MLVLGTFAGKTATAIAGTYGMMTYGMWNGIFNTDGTIKQKIAGIFHNDLSEALDKINENIDDTFKVYASESERNGNIIDRTLGSSHFWN